ncbi:MAG: helix-turn-helix domain-containing protein [Croceibacterium sp.]
MEAADRLDILQHAHLVFQLRQAGFDVTHSRLSGLCLYALLTNVTVLGRGNSSND